MAEEQRLADDAAAAVIEKEKKETEFWNLVRDSAENALKGNGDLVRAEENLSEYRREYPDGKHFVEANGKLAEVIKFKEEKIGKIVDGLKADADKMFDAGEARAAAGMLREYSGEFAKESEGMRKILAEEIESREKRLNMERAEKERAEAKTISEAAGDLREMLRKGDLKGAGVS